MRLRYQKEVEMKRLLAFMLAVTVVIMFSLVGCEKKVEPEHPSTEHPTKAEEQPSPKPLKSEHPTEHPE